MARAALLTLYLAAVAALFLAALPTSARVATWACLSAGIWRGWKQPAKQRLRAREDGQLELWRDDAWKPLQLQADSVALPGLIVLRWREGRRSHSLMLPADALSGDEHRRLRLWLRWRAVVTTDAVTDVASRAVSGSLQ